MSDKTFTLDEVDSIYVLPGERYVVSLIVGYDPDENVQSAEDAAHYALALTTDEASEGTHWYVFDRVTGDGRYFEQSEIE